MSRPESNADAADSLFWDTAEPLMADGRVEEGVIMQSPCLRVQGEFLACPESRTGDLVVKLPGDRVTELIDDGKGLPFAPAKKVFKEWVQVPGRDAALWEQLLDEGLAFVTPKGKSK